MVLVAQGWVSLSKSIILPLNRKHEHLYWQLPIYTRKDSISVKRVIVSRTLTRLATTCTASTILLTRSCHNKVVGQQSFLNISILDLNSTIHNISIWNFTMWHYRYLTIWTQEAQGSDLECAVQKLQCLEWNCQRRLATNNHSTLEISLRRQESLDKGAGDGRRR